MQELVRVSARQHPPGIYGKLTQHQYHCRFGGGNSYLRTSHQLNIAAGLGIVAAIASACSGGPAPSSAAAASSTSPSYNARQAVEAYRSQGVIRISSRAEGRRVRVRFQDDGPGISPENLKKIFNPFFTTKPVGKGTGLGLSLSYGIIQEHGGSITAESTPGQGTTFIIDLPITDQNREAVIPGNRRLPRRRPPAATDARFWWSMTKRIFSSLSIAFCGRPDMRHKPPPTAKAPWYI